MEDVVISGTGFYVPPHVVTTEELVASYNKYVKKYNKDNAKDILLGTKTNLEESNVDFVIQASGIHKRHVIEKDGILNPDIMYPVLTPRTEGELSIQCEMAMHAAKEALHNSNKTPKDIDAVIVACSNIQRPYPGIAIEIQAALGCSGFAYDINSACSSASFGINMARSLIISNQAKCILMVNPEIYTAHLNFRDRRSHFIFGDACSATILEKEYSVTTNHAYKILSSKVQTQFSNNITNDFGFLNRSEQTDSLSENKLFVQNGKKVREEIVPMVAAHIIDHLANASIPKESINRFWLHQANLHMINDIAKQVLGRNANVDELPLILNEFGNTGASGVIIAFNKFHKDLHTGDLGVICSFGAGYTVGSLIVKKL
jgi:beta-ketodecanoyl-[acyl-carrier-protein] synthase